MHHEMLTQRALFCIDVMAKRVMLSQHFGTHVVPPLVDSNLNDSLGGWLVTARGVAGHCQGSGWSLPGEWLVTARGVGGHC
jgi:hypothetical protein